mgnify:CR=1 FL=1
MPKFLYIALDQNGQEVTGELDAANEAEAVNLLRQSQLYPTQVAQEGRGDAAVKKAAKTTAAKSKGKTAVKAGANAKVKPKTLMIFTRQLATLIDSGLPLLRGLTVLSRQEPNPVMKSTVSTIADNVQTGSTFSETLSQYPKIFDKLYINMVKAGELGGVLELVLIRLAEYQEKAQKLKNKVVAAMVYPIIVMFIALAIMVFLMLVIVPRFEKIFEDMLGDKNKLPELTKWVIGFSRWMGDNVLWLGLGIVVVVVVWKMFASTPGGRRSIDSMKLKLPLFGDVPDGADDLHGFALDGVQGGVAFDHVSEAVQLLADIRLIFLAFGDHFAQRVDEIAEHVADFLEISGDVSFFPLPQLGDEIPQTLPVAVADRAGGRSGGSVALFEAGIGGRDQDVSRPLLAQIVDGLRAVLVDVEGEFAQDAEQVGRSVQPGIIAARWGGNGDGSGRRRRRFVGLFFAAFFSPKHGHTPRRKHAKAGANA